MPFVLSELATGSAVGTYEFEAAALEAVAQAVHRAGVGAADRLSLVEHDGHGGIRLVGGGGELARHALAAFPAARASLVPEAYARAAPTSAPPGAEVLSPTPPAAEEFRRLGEAYETRARDVEELLAFLAGEQTDAVWPTATTRRLRERWTADRRALLDLCAALRSRARELHALAAGADPPAPP